MNIKRALANTSLVVISLLVAFLLSELVVRVMNIAPEVVYIEKWRIRLAENPKIGFESIPNFDSTGKSVQYHSYDGRANNEGFRDYDHSLEKPAGSRRIAIIGDSITAGLWVNDDAQVYPAVMEERLRETGLNVDVMNFGVSGYNTQQEVETLKDKVLRYKPDLVILAYCLNDRWQDDGGIYRAFLQEKNKSLESGKVANVSELNPIIRHSDLLRFLKFNVMNAASSQVEADVADRHDKFNTDTVAEYFVEPGELSRTHDFETLVLIFPDFGNQDENLSDAEPYKFADEHEFVKSLAEANELPHLDLRPMFQECRNSLNNFVSYDLYHPNPQGHMCAGNNLADYIASAWEMGE